MPDPKPRIRVHTGYDRSVTVYVDDQEVASGNYDELGWAGLDAISNAAEAVATAAGLTVERTEGPDAETVDD